MSKSTPKVRMFLAVIRINNKEELVGKFTKKDDALFFIADRSFLSNDEYTSRIYEVEVDANE